MHAETTLFIKRVSILPASSIKRECSVILKQTYKLFSVASWLEAEISNAKMERILIKFLKSRSAKLGKNIIVEVQKNFWSLHKRKLERSLNGPSY